MTFTGVPHATTEDDVYNGFFVPKGWYSRCTDVYSCLVIHVYRCSGDDEHMVRNLPYPPFARLASTFVRAVLHDPVVYPDPDSFKPERFINEDGSLRDDPILTSLFGFGKRICPGRHLADAMIFIVIASLLSVFNIEKGNNTNGATDDYPFTGGGIRYGHRVSLMTWEKIGELTTGVSLLVARALSLVRSSQEIEKRKS